MLKIRLTPVQLPSTPTALTVKETRNKKFLELKRTHPVISYIKSTEITEGLRNFIFSKQCSLNGIPNTLTDFFRCYINYAIEIYGTQRNIKLDPSNNEQEKRKIILALGQLAFTQIVNKTVLDLNFVNQVLPKLQITKETLSIQNRSFGFLQRAESSSDKELYCFKKDEMFSTIYMSSIYLANKIVSSNNCFGSKPLFLNSVIHTLKKSPHFENLCRMTLGILSGRPKTQKKLLKNLVKHCKNKNLTPVGIASLCVDLVYETRDSGQLTRLIDEYTTNQTLDFSCKIRADRLFYACHSIGYFVSAAGDHLYGLNLSGCSIDYNAAVALTASISNVSDNCLQHLDLSDNPLGVEGARQLQSFLVKANRLSYLDVSGCKLGERGLAALTDQIVCLPLRTLKAARNKIGPCASASLAPISRCLTLERLDLSANEFDHLTAAKLAYQLNTMPALSDLDLSCNEIKRDACREMIRWLAPIKSLETVRLDGNRMPAELVELVRRAVQDKKKGYARHLWKLDEYDSRSELLHYRDGLKRGLGESRVEEQDSDDSDSATLDQSPTNVTEGKGQRKALHRPIYVVVARGTPGLVCNHDHKLVAEPPRSPPERTVSDSGLLNRSTGPKPSGPYKAMRRIRYLAMKKGSAGNLK